LENINVSSLRRQGSKLVRRSVISALASLSLMAPAWAEQESELLLQQRIEAHITFLADDLLRGRQPGTDGYNIAAAYVASQFRQLGLTPAGSDGSYFQNVPLRSASLQPGTASLSLDQAGEITTFKFTDDFYMSPSKAHTNSSVDAEMVFAGYGIDAPALDYSDYAGLDVKGKILVVLDGHPKTFPSEVGAHFSSGREIARSAIAHGAAGLLVIQTPASEKRVSWQRIQALVGKPSMGWLDSDGKVFASFPQIQVSAYLRNEAAEVLFADAPISLQELFALDEKGEALGGFELHGKLHMSQASTHETISSPNVAAYLQGSDPLLNSEYVVYTAHLDHIGELAGEGHADAINNGALDNASGVAVILETARLFAAREPPRRSVLFIAVTAEEKGLVGSEYFAHNPTVPVSSMVGVINLDMPVLLYEFGDVIAFGAEHSTIGDAVKLAADESGIELTPDPFPEQIIFVRSDHYRFVQQGIPAIFLVTGTHSRDGLTDALTLHEGFLKDHYHAPSDDLNLPIDYVAAAKFTHINYRIGEIIANQLQRPAWHEGDFFGNTFSR
jgi:Zn-dependent M28 family amino/carboxypeptidase